MAHPPVAVAQQPTATAAHPDEAGYPPPPAVLSGGWVRLLRVFGPGAVLASVTVGTGETIFSPRLGAVFGYSMLWTVLAAVIFKGVLVYSGARHLVLTGEHPLEAWSRLPGTRRMVPVLIGLVTIISFPFWVAALTGAVANLWVWITGWGSVRGWGVAILLSAILLSTVQTYQVVERVSTVFLALKTLLIFVAIVVVQPDWLAVLAGLFTPALPDYQPWVQATQPAIAARPAIFHVAVFLGVVGGGLQDYVGYVSFMREKGWGVSARDARAAFPLPTTPEQRERARLWLRAPLLDVAFSFVTVLVMTGSFMVLGAAVLHPGQAVPTDADLYSQQAQFLGVIHPGLVSLYKAGIFVAIFAAIYGVFEVYTRSAYEPLRAVLPGRTWNMNRLRLWTTAYSGLGAMLLLWSERRTVGIVEWVSPLTGVLGCGLWCLAMVWVDRRQMPEGYRMSPLLLGLTVLTGLVMGGLGFYTAIENWTK